MSIFRTLTAMLLLSGAAIADDAARVSGAAAPAISTAPSSAVLPPASLPHNSRAIVLVIGVGAVLVTFQRALSSRRKSA